MLARDRHADVIASLFPIYLYPSNVHIREGRGRSRMRTWRAGTGGTGRLKRYITHSTGRMERGRARVTYFLLTNLARGLDRRRAIRQAFWGHVRQSCVRDHCRHRAPRQPSISHRGHIHRERERES